MSDSDRDRTQFYIDDHAVLFGVIAKSCEKIMGSKGLITCGQGIVTMARERGLRSAIRCVANGDELTIQNYFCYAELFDSAGWNKIKITSYSPIYRTNTLRCGWFDTWKKYELGKYAPVYCDVIDKNLVYGFNPKLQLDMDKVLASGDDCCGFNWIECRFADKFEFDAIMEKRARFLPDITKDFLYQSGHLLSTLRHTINLEYGLLVGNTIIDSALGEYANIFSSTKAERIQTEARANNYLLP